MSNHWVIILNEALVNKDDGQFTVAHEIAHAWQGHQCFAADLLQEEEADVVVKSWGFEILKYRLKVHAEYRKAWERQNGGDMVPRFGEAKKRRKAKKGGAAK
jgi:hypothetical protein